MFWLLSSSLLPLLSHFITGNASSFLWLYLNESPLLLSLLPGYKTIRKRFRFALNWSAISQENSHHQIKCKIKSICDLHVIICELSTPRHALGILRDLFFFYWSLLHYCFFAQIVQSDFYGLRHLIVIFDRNKYLFEIINA